MRQRRTAEQWREILTLQKETRQSDAQVSIQTGVSVSNLRAWRQRLKKQPRSPQPIIEVSQIRLTGDLRVHLPNGLIIDVPSGWSAASLTEIAQRLKAL